MTQDDWTPFVTASGHPAIRGTHTKTIEVVEEADLSARGTCIIGVGAEVDPLAIQGLRGSVEFRFRVGDIAEHVRGLVHPGWTLAEPLIWRTWSQPQGRSLAFAVDKGAAQFSRDLIGALQDPASVLWVEARRQPDPLAPPGGLLSLVGLPVGHDRDLAPRAVDTLLAADLILAEDTRTLKPLLAHIGARAPMMSHHDHNEGARTEALVARLVTGARVALVSDAGMPGIADPGYPLVRAARAAGVMVTAIPGPVAAILGLVISGLPTDRFRFLGFPPRAAARRRAWLTQALAAQGTAIAYETAVRLPDLLTEVSTLAPDRLVVVAKDLTKTHERVDTGTASAVLEALTADDALRGEMVVLLAGAPEDTTSPTDDAPSLDGLLRALVAEGVPTKALAKAFASTTGLPRKHWFDRALALKEDPQG